MTPPRPEGASHARLDRYACLVECGTDLLARVHYGDFEVVRADETEGWPGLLDAAANRSVRDVDPLEAFEVALGWSPDGPEDEELARLGWFLATTATHLNAFARVLGRRLRRLAGAPRGPTITAARKDVMRGVSMVVKEAMALKAYEQQLYRAVRADDDELVGSGGAAWPPPRFSPDPAQSGALGARRRNSSGPRSDERRTTK